MTDTALRPTPEMQTRVAHGHAESLKPASNWDLSGAFAAAGGLHSTTNDLLKFAAANLGLRPSPVLAAMQRSHQPNETAKMQMGLGWGIAKPCGADIRYHNGGTGGYASYLGVDLQRRRGVVVLSNTTNDIDDIGRHLLESRVPLVKDRKAIKLNGKTLDAYVGEYQLQPDVVLTLTRRGDRLFGQRTGGDRRSWRSSRKPKRSSSSKPSIAQMHIRERQRGRVTQVIIHYASGEDETGPKIK